MFHDAVNNDMAGKGNTNFFVWEGFLNFIDYGVNRFGASIFKSSTEAGN